MLRAARSADNRPAAGVDPVLVASHIVTALQSVVSREINPWDPAVLTVARIQAGKASNVIPDTALLEGTFRTLSDKVRLKVREAIRRAKAAGLEGIQVECDTLDQVKEAIEAGADRLLLDNMAPDLLKHAVAITDGRVPLEASGGVTLETIRAIAETGVDFVSAGAITMAAPAVDIGLDLADD